MYFMLNIQVFTISNSKQKTLICWSHCYLVRHFFTHHYLLDWIKFLESRLNHVCLIESRMIELLQCKSIWAGNIISRPFCPYWLNSRFWSVEDSVTKVKKFDVKKEKEVVCNTLQNPDCQTDPCTSLIS